MNKRFALFQVLFSVVALGAVIWWASRQDAPEIPSGTDAIAWLALALALYALATVVRAERWHAILKESRIDAARADCYGLSTVGYMGNNVLPARAGEALRVVLLDGKTGAGKRKILGTIVVERLLDLIVLVIIFVLTVYLVLEGDVVPTDEPLLIAGVGFAALALAGAALWMVHRRGGLRRVPCSNKLMPQPTEPLPSASHGLSDAATQTTPPRSPTLPPHNRQAMLWFVAQSTALRRHSGRPVQTEQ